MCSHNKFTQTHTHTHTDCDNMMQYETYMQLTMKSLSNQVAFHWPTLQIDNEINVGKLSPSQLHGFLLK